MTDTEVDAFQLLLNEAQTEKESSGESAKSVLEQMSAEELALLQKANSLAERINVGGLSEEGAANLLAQPDFSDRVDLNNDGIVEVGAAKNIVFPPVNAPDHVKAAWEEATAGMDESDTMMLQLHMHLSVYGVQADGLPSSTPLSPEEQWSSGGIEKLFDTLRSALDFRVGLEGWTEHNKMLLGLYSRFEQALG
ncbi:hypothetical protein ADIMK_0137 [Marinobacterium lacunae]|uniref:Uncharacterized protein n=2 Tax=Marinobacterium lacunae TaxID=1232683 RepID=A0A081G4B0_9GAMM|nr:hypothetical protein ADIMK_0137 [Marinobacterium lacunae]